MFWNKTHDELFESVYENLKVIFYVQSVESLFLQIFNREKTSSDLTRRLYFITFCLQLLTNLEF